MYRLAVWFPASTVATSFDGASNENRYAPFVTDPLKTIVHAVAEGVNDSCRFVTPFCGHTVQFDGDR